MIQWGSRSKVVSMIGAAIIWGSILGGGEAVGGDSTGSIPRVNPVQKLKPLTIGRV